MLTPDPSILRSIKAFCKPLKKNFDYLMIVGLGGSSLGTKALAQALGPFKKKIYFLDNLDPHLFHAVIKKIKINKTLFLIVSKSGETLETLVLFRALLRLCEQKKLNPSKHFAVITEQRKSPLYLSAQRGKIPLFPLKKDMPGRFSVFSAVTLIPAQLLSVDIETFCTGALKYLRRDLLKLLKFLEKMHSKGKYTLVFFIYSERLSAFGDWLIQLISESLGKKRKGFTPIKAIGPKDQHSILQLFLDGPSDKCFVFITHKPNKKEKLFSKIIEKENLGIIKTFREKRKDFLTIKLPRLNEETLGALFMSFMKLTLALADYLEVNPFDQPAVEHSKEITRQVL